MQAFRVETTVSHDGSLTVRDLPFLQGEKVEVIVLPSSAKEVQLIEETDLHPLRGLPVIYHDPFEPAAPESDWDVYNDTSEIFPVTK
jgi:hypothetical protein